MSHLPQKYSEVLSRSLPTSAVTLSGAGEGESELRFLFLTVNSCYNGFPLLLVNLNLYYIAIISKRISNVKSFLAFFIRISWKVVLIILHPYPQ